MWALIVLGCLAVLVVAWYAAFILRPCLPIWLSGGRIRRGATPGLGPPNFISDHPVRAAIAKITCPFRVVEVSFAGRLITDSGLARLASALERFPYLETLDLDRTKVTGVGFAHLSNLLALRRLLVERLRFTPGQMHALEHALQAARHRAGDYSFHPLAVHFYSRPRQNRRLLDDKASLGGDVYRAECDRCGCLLWDHVEDDKVFTFGLRLGGVTSRQFEGALCPACPGGKSGGVKRPGAPHVRCGDCHPPEAGTRCPECAGELQPVFEEELKALYRRYHAADAERGWR
jgi:hypothetical protein